MTTLNEDPPNRKNLFLAEKKYFLLNNGDRNEDPQLKQSLGLRASFGGNGRAGGNFAT